MDTEVFQNALPMTEHTQTIANVERLHELLGDSDEFALLRETLWIYSQIVDYK